MLAWEQNCCNSDKEYHGNQLGFSNDQFLLLIRDNLARLVLQHVQRKGHMDRRTTDKHAEPMLS
jgi:hypothetical protein